MATTDSAAPVKKSTASFSPADAVVLGCQGFATYSLLSTIISNEKMNSTWFANHPKFAMLGATSALLGGYIMARHKAMQKKLLIHQAFMAAGTSSIFYALYVIYTNKNMYNKPHLTSPHAWLGACSGVALAALNLGTLALQYGPAKDKETTNKGWKLHRILATTSLATLTAAVVTGTIAMYKPTSTTTLKISGGIVGALATLVASAMRLI
jgi:hypothetical protein